jgi:hypothetical protein
VISKLCAYYGQPIAYFTDAISEAQFDLLVECMAEVTSNGEYEIEEYPDEVDQEKYKRIYGNRQVVSM